MKKVIQQGDILFIPVDSIPQAAERVSPENGYYIIARGEASGHTHRVSVQEADLFSYNNLMFLRLKSNEGAKIIHEEHNTKILTDAFYKVVRINEYDYDKEEARKISD